MASITKIDSPFIPKFKSEKEVTSVNKKSREEVVPDVNIVYISDYKFEMLQNYLEAFLKAGRSQKFIEEALYGLAQSALLDESQTSK